MASTTLFFHGHLHRCRWVYMGTLDRAESESCTRNDPRPRILEIYSIYTIACHLQRCRCPNPNVLQSMVRSISQCKFSHWFARGANIKLGYMCAIYVGPFISWWRHNDVTAVLFLDSARHAGYNDRSWYLYIWHTVDFHFSLYWPDPKRFELNLSKQS